MYIFTPNTLIESAKINANYAEITDAWIPYTPTIAAFTGTKNGKYKKIGKTCFVSIYCTLSSGVSGSINPTLPFISVAGTFGFTGSAWMVRQGNYYRIGVTKVDNGQQNFLIFGNDASQWSNTIPATWASGDVLVCSLTYEIA